MVGICLGPFQKPHPKINFIVLKINSCQQLKQEFLNIIPKYTNLIHSEGMMGKYCQSLLNHYTLSRRAENLACPVKTLQFTFIIALDLCWGQAVWCGTALCHVQCKVCTLCQKDVYREGTQCSTGEHSRKSCRLIK